MAIYVYRRNLLGARYVRCLDSVRDQLIFDGSPSIHSALRYSVVAAGYFLLLLCEIAAGSFLLLLGARYVRCLDSVKHQLICEGSPSIHSALRSSVIAAGSFLLLLCVVAAGSLVTRDRMRRCHFMFVYVYWRGLAIFPPRPNPELLFICCFAFDVGISSSYTEDADSFASLMV